MTIRLSFCWATPNMSRSGRLCRPRTPLATMAVLLLFTALILLALSSVSADGTEIIQRADAYLENPDNEQLEKAVANYDGDIDSIVNALRAQEATDWRRITGPHDAQRFAHPEVREKYKDDLLYFYIPKSYDAGKPFALMIFLHGGGEGTKPDYARAITATPEQFKYSYGLRRYIEDIPVITVSPSALAATTSARWCTSDAEQHVVDVIRECRYRFNIDIDRVFLGGQSMGGMGGYHLCQRLSDRIAGGFISSGSWETANWSCMAGTPLIISHGAADAVAPGTPGRDARPRFTDVYYARIAHKLLEEVGVRHSYCEHPGGHSTKYATKGLEEFVAMMKTVRRDPFSPRIVAMTTRGWRGGREMPALRHNKWVSIGEITGGHILFDKILRTGPGPSWNEDRESFLQQGFRTVKVEVSCGQVEAVNRGGNVFEITTRNVKDFSLWLHPQMVDFSRPVTIRLNGDTLTRTAKPSLLDALRSYRRHRDWGLIYYSELKLTAQ
jgi:poly(3-hydroxybutyrate) depolymerase